MKATKKDYEAYFKYIVPVLRRKDLHKADIKSIAHLKKNARAYMKEEPPKVTYLANKQDSSYIVKKVFVNTSAQLIELYYKKYIEAHYASQTWLDVCWHKVFKAGNKAILYWKVSYK